MRDIQATLERFIAIADAAGGDDLLLATDLARLALAMDLASFRPTVEHALFTELWGHVSRALDHDEFDSSYATAVDALEAEMAGHVLFQRQARGWLVRAPDAPTEFPQFTDAVASI